MTNEKQQKEIERLTNKVARLTKQVENLKKRNEKLKADLLKKTEAYKKLELKAVEEGKVKEPPVKRLYRLYPEVAEELARLCIEWNLKTMNMRNTTMAIFKIIEPDSHGVVEYTANDVLSYIRILRKLGRSHYMQNATLAQYYEPYDSLVLFKHFKMIRKNLFEWLAPLRAKSEKMGYKVGNVTIGGVEIEPVQKTVLCSWEDLMKQKKGVLHVNDSADLKEFKGDDLIRERERRMISKTGLPPLRKGVEEIIEYQAKKYWDQKGSLEDIVNNTTIKEV